MNGNKSDIWRLYGSVTLPFDGRNLEAELGAKPLALLIALIATDGPVSRKDLAEMLWPRSSSDSARHNLRQALFAVRKALGEKSDAIMFADARTLRFIPGSIAVDLHIVRESSASWATDIGQTLDLIRGEFLENYSLVTPAFDDNVDKWRQSAATYAVAFIDRNLPDARGKNRQDLIELRRKFSGSAAVDSDLATQTSIDPYLQQVSRHRSSWSKIVAGLAIGLGLGAAVILGAFAVSRDFRDILRTHLLDHRLDVPSIAVRPLRALNADPLENSLAGGVTVGVTYGLYSVAARDLFVVTVPSDLLSSSRGSAAIFAAELGVRYLITGTVEHDAGNVRVFVSCFDADKGHDIWQNRFTSPVTEAFQLQDEITLRILQGLEIDISSAERNRIQYLSDTDNLEAWLYSVRGLSELIQLTPSKLEESFNSYRAALRIDPDYISARRGVAWYALLKVRFGLAENPDTLIREARNHVDVILRHDPENGMSKAIEGLLLLLEGSWKEAVEAGEAATKLLPGSADVWAVLAHSYTFSGEPTKAIKAIDKAMALSPGHPLFYQWIKARALRLSGELEEAISLLEQGTPKEEASLVHLVELAAAYSAAGELTLANNVARSVKSVDSDFSASEWVSHPAIKDAKMQSLEFELLSKAGL